MSSKEETEPAGDGTINGLTVLKSSELARFSNNELQEAMDYCDEDFGVGDLIVVKTPAAGGTNWTIETIAGEQVEKTIRGILVYVQRSGVLWPSFDPDGSGNRVLQTYDFKTAQLMCDPEEVPDEMIDVLEDYKLADATETEPAIYNWEGLPYNQFGSGKDGHGKRCKDQRVLFILRKDDIYPLMIRVQPGSLKNITKFIKQIPAVAKVPYFRCEIELSLTKEKSQGGKDFSQIHAKLVGILDRADGELIKENFWDVLHSGVAKQADEELTESDDAAYTDAE
ncbi:hypothetical protein Pan241w_11660 [Gimesia alba]|uniref:Uncharacterized protein n=1 Tax=Gimesia alba TaxID=2527973 RepID=A0A517RB37_9PLAN|nr:hypothetical protein [Gimesia alba]QDT41107.1 hypothetical protein Pan241w_11660 [Gimesia alba]